LEITTKKAGKFWGEGGPKEEMIIPLQAKAQLTGTANRKGEGWIMTGPGVLLIWALRELEE